MNNPFQPPLAITDKAPAASRLGPVLRWLYVLAILATGISLGIDPPMGLTIRTTVTVHLIMMLTYPLGAIGSLCAFALVYTGIGTVHESFFLFTPVFVLAGYLQWYVIVPRLVRRFGRGSRV